MPNQRPIIPITVLITIVAIAILMVGVAWWYVSHETVIPEKYKNSTYCESDSDCVIQPGCCTKESVNRYNYKPVKDLICPTVLCTHMNVGTQCVNNTCQVITKPTQDCDLITTAEECDNRSDCLAVDICGCTTEWDRSRKCGYTIENPCVCVQGGFSRCEKLTCPSSINTNTESIPNDKASCEAQGGLWGRVGLSPVEGCNLPTKDGGKECLNGSECEAYLCIAALTKEEVTTLSTEGSVEKNGICPSRKLNVGCMYVVADGKVTGGQLCVD